LLLVPLLFSIVGCSTGPDAPRAVAGDLVCHAGYCVTVPEGWTILEQGDDFIRFAHPATDAALATVAPVNMEALVTAAGGTWPTQTENVVRAFWQLLGETGDASFGSLTFEGDGSVRSRGSYGDGRLWDRLIPVEGARAVGMEVRGPNSTWEAHADVFLDTLVLTP
jgi:hypothetical protein